MSAIALSTRYGTVVEDSVIPGEYAHWNLARRCALGGRWQMLFNLKRNVHTRNLRSQRVMRANGAVAHERKMLRAVQEPRTKGFFELQEKTT